MKKIVLTGGGTAGHVMPNIALIPSLQEKGIEVHYIGSIGGMEKGLVEKVPGVIYHGIHSGKLRRYFDWKNFTDPFKVIAGYFGARRIIKQIAPQALFSKGGFVTVPVVMAAKGCKIPTILHESDYTPGLANRICIKFADKVLVTFEDTLKHLPQSKGIFTGTPIRSDLFKGSAARGRSLLGFDASKPILLVTGGSQGAQAINNALRGCLNELLKTFDILHLCGKDKTDNSLKDVKGYVQIEFAAAELTDFFACTDIALSRAGANTIFEFLALNVPALLVPLESGRGDQIVNAAYFEKHGFAKVLAESAMTPQTLLEALIKLNSERESYKKQMNAGNGNGTNKVLDVIYKVMEEA